ncbi:family 43 glycosylhydrolase [Candidatus Saccharibacteria bacterium]|nr:family 43 glycosylhydrolase [Candidatus Saccharibacteria bacterium]
MKVVLKLTVVDNKIKMALHHKQQSSEQPPAPRPTLPEPITSVDDKIANENIQMYGFRDDNNPSTLTRFFWLIGSHRLAAIVASVALLTLVGLAVFAASHHSNDQPTNPGTVAGDTGDGSSEPVETFDYNNSDTPTDTTAPDSGTPTSSGTGTAAENPSATKPGSPTNLTLTAQNYQISASWKGVSGATQYELQISRNSTMSSPRQITSGTTSTVIPGLASGTKYYVWVRAVNAKGPSSWSRIGSITTTKTSTPQQPLPGKVGSVALKINATNSISISWGSATNASRYTVTRASNSSMTTARKEYAATTSRSYTINDLSAGTTYYFTIRASNSRGFGPSSNVISGKTRLAATSISKLSLLSNNNVTVTAKKTTGATKYDLSYATKSNFSNAATVTSGSSSITAKGLKAGTKYYFRVRAKDANYTTAWSKSASVTTRYPSFKNPIINSSTGAPSLIKGSGGMYYIYATQNCNGKVFCRWQSKDLIHWKINNSAIFTSRPGVLSGGNLTWAPDVTKVGSWYIMTYTGCDNATVSVGHRRCIGYATSKHAEGPYTARGVLVSRGYKSSTDIPSGPGAVDSHIVVNGSNVYLVYGSGGIGIVPLQSTGNGTYKAVKSQFKMLVWGTSPVAEGSYLYKHGSYWYLYYSYGDYKASAIGTSKEYSTRVVRSTSIMGNYRGPSSAAPKNNTEQNNLKNGKFKLLISGSSSFRGPGCPSLFTDTAGKDWILYHSYPKGKTYRAALFDRIVYTNGWPSVNNGHPSTGSIPGPAYN